MGRRLVLAVALVLTGGAGCKRGAPSNAAVGDASPSAAVPGASPAGAPTYSSGSIFSAPIAGARLASAPTTTGRDVIAAGLVVATRSVTAARIDASGKVAWTHAVVPDVAWSADAELHVRPIAAGAAIAWRGPVGKKSGHVVVVIAPDGHVLDGPIDVGSFVCATDDGLAWSEAAPNGATRVHLRNYSAASPAERDETGPGLMEDFTLTCGAHRAYVVVEGDEATPTKVYAIGAGSGREPLATIAPLALGADEERDLFPWASGDELGLVRVASGGAVQAADVRAGIVTPIHADKSRVLPEDDVVGVDADARQVVLVTTHDETEECPNGRGGSSVHVLRIPRQREAGGGAATSLRIAPSACGRDVGPFWTNALGRSLIVAWSERASRPEKTSAPITGLAYRALEEGAATGRVAQAADAIADAGCDEAHCYAVALVRDPGADGSKPAAMRVLSYP